jgi:hypothetical protein
MHSSADVDDHLTTDVGGCAAAVAGQSHHRAFFGKLIPHSFPTWRDLLGSWILQLQILRRELLSNLYRPLSHSLVIVRLGFGQQLLCQGGPFITQRSL